MKILLFACIVMLFCSCGGPGSVISRQLSGSDSLVINFNNPQSTTLNKTVTTTEKTAIKKLINYADSKTSEAYKCGYDGSMLFYTKGILTGDVSFNYSGDGCHHFIMEVNGKLTPTTMRNEAANFLQSLAEGKGWY